MLRSRTTRMMAGSALTAALVLSAAPAYAGDKPAPAPTGDGSHALCKRVPKLEARIARDLTRLNGDATVRGSIARLSARVANAKKEGHTAVATYLQNRLTFRQSLVPMLQQRQQDLKSVQTWCAAQGSNA